MGARSGGVDNRTGKLIFVCLFGVCSAGTATQVPSGELPKKQVVDVTEVPATPGTEKGVALGRPRVSVPDDADRISVDSELDEEEERTLALRPTPPQSRTSTPAVETATPQKPTVTTSTPPSQIIIDVQPETVPLPESTVATPTPQEPEEKKHVEIAPLPPTDLIEPVSAKDKPKKTVAFELPATESLEEPTFQAPSDTTVAAAEEKAPVEPVEASSPDITDAAPAVKDVTPKLVPVATLPAEDPVPELVLEADTSGQDIEAKVEDSAPPFLAPAAAKVTPAEVVLVPAVAEPITHAESGAAETALREPPPREATESPVEIEKHDVEAKKVDLAPIDTDSVVVESQSLPPTPQSLEAPKDKEPVLPVLDDLVTEEETTFKILPVAELEQEESAVRILPVGEEEEQYKAVEAAHAEGTTFRIIASPPLETPEEAAFHILPIADEQPKDVYETPVEEPKDLPGEPEETFHTLPAPSTPPTLPNQDLETWIQQQFPTHGMTPDGAFVGEKVFAQHLLELAEQQGGHRDLDRLRAVVGEIAE